jgi:hypothetical protein
MTSKQDTQGAKAIRELHRAEDYRNRPTRPGTIDQDLNLMDAQRAQSAAEDLLQPKCELIRNGGEILHCDATSANSQELAIRDTLSDKPDMIAIDASGARLTSADDVGVLVAAVDAENSVRARNSLEKMLCHQIAAAHDATMRLFARSTQERLPPVEQVRLTNAAARMMQAYNDGLLTLQKLRTGGKQTVVVQHVNVSGGGQAVVAGELKNQP